MIAGGALAQPLEEGAHLMTMSTYKSLGGPAGGLIVTNDAAIAERLDAIAYPGLTANFDAAKSAALAITLLDWRELGAALRQGDDRSGAGPCDRTDISRPAAFTPPTVASPEATSLPSRRRPSAAARPPRKPCARPVSSTCGIGLPMAEVAGDLNGLRLGTPELVRRGVTLADIPALAALIAEALRSNSPEAIAPRTAKLRSKFQSLHYVRG